MKNSVKNMSSSFAILSVFTQSSPSTMRKYLPIAFLIPVFTAEPCPPFSLLIKRNISGKRSTYFCAICGVATLSISYYDLGVATGKMAAKILTGEADISTMPVGYAETVTPKYNADICASLNITPLEGYEAIG